MFLFLLLAACGASGDDTAGSNTAAGTGTCCANPRCASPGSALEDMQYQPQQLSFES